METVKDIVEEMRNVASIYLSGGNDSTSVFEMLSTYSSRLDAAYDRNIEHRNATKRKYTADEMREAADALEYCGNPHSASMLRQAADDLERERRYEYGLRVDDSFPDLCGIWKCGDLQEAKTMADEFPENGGSVTIVRREIVDWKEVPNV